MLDLFVEVPETVSFDHEPGTVYVLAILGYRNLTGKGAPMSFGVFDNTGSAIEWLEKVGFAKDYEAYKAVCPGGYVWHYSKEEPLIIDGDAFGELLVILSYNPPLPILFKS